MKKHLLIGMAICFGGAALAQGTSTPAGITLQKNKLVAVKVPTGPKLGGPNDSFESMVSALTTAPVTPQYRSFTSAVIGTTEYQLQTNSSLCNRFIKNSDNTMAATWTSSWISTWSDRGTGYNYFDGSTWSAIPLIRLENTRVGWPNVATTPAGGEYIITHESPGTGGLHTVTRPVKGTGTWTDGLAGNIDFFPRMAMGGPTGNTVHVVSATSSSTGPLMYHGLNGAVTYSRSLDGGVTWDKIRTIIPAIDSSNYLGFGGDEYSLDVKGSTVAIAIGGFSVDVILLKSTDNGNTWTKTIVHKFPIPMYNPVTMYTDTINPLSASEIDTLETNDASVHVMLDNSNNAHVWYGRMKVVCDAPGTGTGLGLSYFPGLDGLMYWNETMGSAPPVLIAGCQDINGDNILNIYVDPLGASLGFGTFQTSLTSFPSAGIDASGKIYLTYSSVFEGFNENGEGVGYPPPSYALTLIPISTAGKSFRHQYVMRSDDNGATWCTPIDITAPDLVSGLYDFTEGVYGVMAKNVDTDVHIISQEDNSPGHGVVSSGTPTDPQGGPANIRYFKIPVADLACGAGIHENNTVTDMNIYPNPTENTSVNLVLNSSKSTKTVVKVYNVMGQEIAHFENNLTVGINKMTINISDYNVGVYFVSAMVDGKNFTQKLIVK